MIIVKLAKDGYLVRIDFSPTGTMSYAFYVKTVQEVADLVAKALTDPEQFKKPPLDVRPS